MSADLMVLDIHRSKTDESVETVKTFTEDLVSFIRKKNTELSGHDLGWSLNMTQGTERSADVFGESEARLRKGKAKYDPKNVWSKGFIIEPLFE